MTPLAHELAKQLILPRKDRDPFWAEHADALRHALDDTHFFETSEVEVMLPEIGAMLDRTNRDAVQSMLETYIFLPAPKTWFEFRPFERSYRVGFYLETDADKTIHAKIVEREYMGSLVSFGIEAFDKADSTVYHFDENTFWFKEFYADRYDVTLARQHFLGCIVMHLLMINSPRVIGRKQFMPHRGLERRLTKAMGGRMFPMHGWTEIKLQITKPIEIDDGEPHESHITGRRALHFCRKHIRIRRGRLEYVSAHWRGDASLGIKRSRYVVTP